MSLDNYVTKDEVSEKLDILEKKIEEVSSTV